MLILFSFPSFSSCHHIPTVQYLGTVFSLLNTQVSNFSAWIIYPVLNRNQRLFMYWSPPPQSNQQSPTHVHMAVSKSYHSVVTKGTPCLQRYLKETNVHVFSSGQYINDVLLTTIFLPNKSLKMPAQTSHIVSEKVTLFLADTNGLQLVTTNAALATRKNTGFKAHASMTAIP